MPRWLAAEGAYSVLAVHPSLHPSLRPVALPPQKSTPKQRSTFIFGLHLHHGTLFFKSFKRRHVSHCLFRKISHHLSHAAPSYSAYACIRGPFSAIYNYGDVDIIFQSYFGADMSTFVLQLHYWTLFCPFKDL